MAKKISKWFRIGVEGDTCDGRVISATDIQEMADGFDTRVYGCRINLEHIRSVIPDSPFCRYGDVTEVKAEVREVIWRQRVNDAAKGCTLAYASNNDLDVMAGNNNTGRQIVTPADNSTIPPTPAVMESDTDLRLRAQQAYEGLSVAGPVGAYEYHGRSADGRVADISVVSPSPACVTITVLSREDDGTASDELLTIVEKALNAEEVRPVGDRVTVQSAEIVPYQIDATLYFYPGPEAAPIRQAAEEKLKAYITAQQRLGRDIRQSAIYAALHVEGVQRVELAAPLADIVLSKYQASCCTEYRIADGGADE
ncbi:hypothetical protein QE11421_8790 [Escherichia coli]|nr:hypothetical protein QE11421_8790 [Escherichia coli]